MGVTVRDKLRGDPRESFLCSKSYLSYNEYRVPSILVIIEWVLNEYY